MTSTTPTHSRPHTPLRPPSRSSLRTSNTTTTNAAAPTRPLGPLTPQLAELSDSLSVLEQNMLALQLMNESLSRFNENFAAFLYGLEMNAFVVDWPEAPVGESWARSRVKQKQTQKENWSAGDSFGGSGVVGERGEETDSTLISDTTFASMRQTPRRRTLGQDIGAAAEIRRGRNGKSGIPARSGGFVPGTTRGGASASGRGGGGGSGTVGRGRGTARTRG